VVARNRVRSAISVCHVRCIVPNVPVAASAAVNRVIAAAVAPVGVYDSEI
jgi:hypothetical protein